MFVNIASIPFCFTFYLFVDSFNARFLFSCMLRLCFVSPKPPYLGCFPFFHRSLPFYGAKPVPLCNSHFFENVSRKCLPVLSVKLSSPPLFRLFSTRKEAPHSASFSFSFQLFAGKNTLDLSSRRFCTISRHSPKRWKCTISLSRRNLSGLRSSGSSVRVIRCS